MAIDAGFRRGARSNSPSGDGFQTLEEVKEARRRRNAPQRQPSGICGHVEVIERSIRRQRLEVLKTRSQREEQEPYGPALSRAEVDLRKPEHEHTIGEDMGPLVCVEV